MADNILAPMCEAWLRRIESAQEHKKANFQKAADLGMKFFHGPYDFMYEGDFSSDKENALRFVDDDGEVIPKPAFRMSLNRVAEMEQLFGPVLYHTNPDRQVNKRKLPELPPQVLEMMVMQEMQAQGIPLQPPPMMPPPMPGMEGMMPPDPMQIMMMQKQQQRDAVAMMDETRTILLQTLLNYTPNELGLKDHSRLAISEAIICGKGLLWTEIQVAKNGRKIPGSFFDSVYNLNIDPDMESENDAAWISRKCIHPVWKVEKDYGLPPGSVKANLESMSSQFGRPSSDQALRDRAGTNDLLEYHKVYSRMGCGARMSGVDNAAAKYFEQYGDNVFLVVAKGMPWPLNLPMDVPIQASEVADRLKWPIPFHDDMTSPWPYTAFQFHPVPRKVWPMSHLAPAMGELLFLNWAYSYLATKIATTSRDLLAVAKSLEKEARNALTSGKNLAILEMAQGQGFDSIDKMIQFIQHPPMNKDIWDVIQAVESNFERRTGLSELIYGSSQRGMRSAEEAALKGEQLKIRPDDMATRVEEAMTLVARKEAIAAHLISGEDVKPIMGEDGAKLWDTIIGPLSPETAMEFEYRIEANSIRRPNRERDVANATQAMQTIFQPLFGYGMQTGNFDPVNAVLRLWAKAMDMDPIIIPPPPPPPQMPPPIPGKEPPPDSQLPPAA